MKTNVAVLFLRLLLLLLLCLRLLLMCCRHLPEGPPISGPWTAPGTKNEAGDLRRLAESEGGRLIESLQERT